MSRPTRRATSITSPALPMFTPCEKKALKSPMCIDSKASEPCHAAHVAASSAGRLHWGKSDRVHIRNVIPTSTERAEACRHAASR
jgi:hypothetical protein